MAISASLIAKGIAGTLTLAAPVATSVYYKDSIYELFVTKSEPIQESQNTEKNSIEIIKKLGIETTETNLSQSLELDLSKENLEKLKLLDTSEKNTVEGLDSGTVKLKIEKTDEGFFQEGFKFTLISENESAVKIKKTANDSEPSITLSKGKGVEFKLKSSTNSYSLEKLLSEEEIKTNLKLNCGSDNTCTIQDGQKINVKEASNRKSEGVNFRDSTKKIKLERYKEGYNGGFKFSVDSDIELQKDEASESGTLDPNKLLQSASYEAIEENGKWFLSKKS